VNLFDSMDRYSGGFHTMVLSSRFPTGKEGRTGKVVLCRGKERMAYVSVIFEAEFTLRSRRY